MELEKEAMAACTHEAEHELTAARAKGNMPKDEDIARVASTFKSISAPSRLKILFALRQGELCVLHIVAAVGGTQSGVSHQLRLMKSHGIVKSRREGQNILYSLADEHVVAVLELACAHLHCHI